MKQVLLIDCCIRREESRTKQLADAFLSALPADCNVTVLNLMDEKLAYFEGEFLGDRQRLLEKGELNHPRFRYAHQFAEADVIVMAAPFWDLGFPALLKVYIENISVDGITFGCNETGCFGTCKATDLVFLTTRGGYYEGSPMEMGSRYLEALKDFFGIGSYHCIAADGIDIAGADIADILDKAKEQAKALAQTL